jgi:hypothetical protein
MHLVYFHNFGSWREKRTLQSLEQTTEKKTSWPKRDQLEKGFITQEVYTARKAKLDAELAQKKLR